MMTSLKRKIWTFLLLLVIAGGACGILLTKGALQAQALEESDSKADQRQEDEARAAQVDGKIFSTFAEAMAQWKEGTTLILLQTQKMEDPLSVSENKTLDLNSFELNCSSGRTLIVENGGDLMLRGAGLVSGGGVYVENGGRFQMNGGTISGNVAENGGGVYVESGGTFIMNGGTIEGNRATRNGGGVYVDGAFTVGGAAQIFGNTDRTGNANNLYLSKERTFLLRGDFSGKVGVTAYSVTGVIVSSGASSAVGVLSDNLEYTVVEEGGKLLIVLAPLDSIEAEYTASEKVFPTSSIDILKKDIEVKGTNLNGVAYSGEIGIELKVVKLEQTQEGEVETLTDEFSLGSNTVLVTAYGRGGETAVSRVTVEVVAPKLLSVALGYRQSGIVYFDSDVSVLYGIMNFSVTGNYEDGRTRQILRTSDETASAAREEYIRDYYDIACALSSHTNGLAKGIVNVFEEDGTRFGGQEFDVAVSRHILDVSGLRVLEISILEQSGEELSSNAFTPDLPDGIKSTLTLNGVPFTAGTLKAGIYTIGIELSVSDKENYELKGARLSGRLLVFERVRSGSSEGISYEITCEGGISPEWQFSLRDVTKESKAQLSDDLKGVQAFEMTFLPGESTAEPGGEFTVRLLLSEELVGKEDLRLFRLRADGEPEEVEVRREGDYLVFETSKMIETQFIIAADSNIGLYVTLAICFGVLCVIGAGVLLWYFIYKRKLSLKE